MTELADQMRTTTCPHCGDTVPAGSYCGACGAHLTLHREGTRAFRTHAYAAAPSEHVLRLSVVSSLFPHLPHRSRAPFRVALAVLLAALVVLAALRLQAPMIAVAALGVPLLFQLYLQESDVFEDLPALMLGLAVVLGAGAGVGWALITDDTVRDAINSSVLSGFGAKQFWLAGVLIPIVEGILIIVPAAVVWFLRRPHRDESMDGFLIGSIGAVGFSAASTIARLAPQLGTGIVARHRPVAGIVIEALIQGLAVPVTAASVGGVVGSALWVRRRSQVHLGRWLASARAMVPVALAIYLALGLIDLWQPPQNTLLALHLLFAAIALLALRYGVHAVLLHEEHDVTIGAPRVCPHCEEVVPAMPFCPHCGYAARASSRSARARHEFGPPVAATAGDADGAQA